MWRFGFRKPSAGALWGWRRCCCDVQTETRWLSGWLKASQTLWSLAPGEAVHAEERLALESVGARKDAAGQLGHGGRTRTAGQNLPLFPSHVHTKVLELRTAFLLNESTSTCLVKFPSISQCFIKRQTQWTCSRWGLVRRPDDRAAEFSPDSETFVSRHGGDGNLLPSSAAAARLLTEWCDGSHGGNIHPCLSLLTSVIIKIIIYNYRK